VTPETGATPGPRTQCRLCREPLTQTFADLGMSPLCESYVAADQLDRMEPFFPLHVWVCSRCFLVQLGEYVSPAQIFSEYAYFSSYSESWVRHAKSYADRMTERLNLGSRSLVVEVASNDGYLLQHFVAKGIPVLGIEPSRNVAASAVERGIPTIERFFGPELARELASDGRQADLIVGNNVLAHVPDLNGFVDGLRILLKPAGTITMEFPHLWRLMDENQFDTIYHEHFSYLSFLVAEQVFAAHDMTVFDVEELSTHGGSLRIYARHAGDSSRPVTLAAETLRDRERNAGFESLDRYSGFMPRVAGTKRRLLSFLIEAKEHGMSVAAYGAPGKGNTLLNYCGIRTDFLDYAVDRNPYKQGKFLPGTHIPIFPVEKLDETRPDYVLILPWNLKDEIVGQMTRVRRWGGRFVVPIPRVEIIE
jgi:SAM-dependent methyltransferase